MTSPNKFSFSARESESENPANWFDIQELPANVIALREPGHIQDVSSFLILGSERTLLFDTGMGIGNIHNLVEGLTELEVVVLNSHSHFDHIGDDWRFPAIHFFDDGYGVNVLTQGYSSWDLRFDRSQELFSRPLPPGFTAEEYSIPPVKSERIIRVQDGHRFDLGNRQLRVIHTPGHSQDHISLLDQENHVLFPGDIFGEWMLGFFDERLPKFGKSNPKEYADSLDKLARLAPGLDYLYPSHGDPLADPGELITVSAAFTSVLSGDQKPDQEEFYGDTRKVYSIEGYSIWL
jgi:glyoxylase-like metal-dependent hydrolase (beta-lactamase superfamily II)